MKMTPEDQAYCLEMQRKIIAELRIQVAYQSAQIKAMTQRVGDDDDYQEEEEEPTLTEDDYGVTFHYG
jgi:hypothetical protein|tara:strand:+ start:618 stop:821 length:204 start_codon:yes stop_codon:yes gene_type:complete